MFDYFFFNYSSRIQGEDSLSKLTKFGHSHFERGFMELDKQIFSIFLAIEVLNYYIILIVYLLVLRLSQVKDGLQLKKKNIFFVHLLVQSLLSEDC